MSEISRLDNVSLVTVEDFPDAFYNYEVHEEIGRGATATVFRATCRRGRLRNRCVALKKILPSSKSQESSAEAFLTTSTRLHQALHHPSIVSLLSSFSSHAGHYHVLELCSRGTLSAFVRSRDPPVLSEPELRGVVKTLVDALVYLRKERVIHRDLKASNILLTEDFRIKLSDFGLALRLPTTTSTTSTFCGSPNYVAPEIVSRLPYGFAVDIWSLGSLMVTCLSGAPAFEAQSVDEIFVKICRAQYTLPETVSGDVTSLISSLLQLDPKERLSLNRILAHQFFNPSLPIHPLSDSSHPLPPVSKVGTEYSADIPTRSRPKRYPQSLSKMSMKPVLSTSSDEESVVFNYPRRPMADVANLGLRKVLSNELPRTLRLPAVDTIRRVVSAPDSGRTSAGSNLHSRKPSRSGLATRVSSVPATPALTVDSGSLHSTGSLPSGTGYHEFDLGLTRRPPSFRPHLLDQKAYANHPWTRDDLATMPTALNEGAVKSTQTCNDLTPVALSSPRTTLTKQHPQLVDRLPPSELASVSNERTSTRDRGTILNTIYLTPQTHKVSQGQIVVLPSLSLLVDFREGERRKGRSGKEVMVVSSDGMKINVHSAPHLSTPCCLAEPDAIYAVDDLPTAYRNLYSDAVFLVNKLKRRIPVMVLYKPEAKYTLMANGPHGDIEFHAPSVDQLHDQGKHRPHDALSATASALRIRLSRQHRSIEIARHVPGASGTRRDEGVWTRKVFTTAGAAFAITDEDWDSLELIEQAGLRHVAEFLRVCESVEALERAPSVLGAVLVPEASPPSGNGDLDTRQRFTQVFDNMMERKTIPPGDGSFSGEDTESERNGGFFSTEATAASSTVLSSFSLLPRPSKFSAALSRQSGETVVPVPATCPVSHTYCAGADSGPEEAEQECSGPTVRGSAVLSPSQTRFIPSIGWCVRHVVGNEELYQVMFHDGASLQVNASEDAVRLTRVAGGVTRFTLREAARNIEVTERMEALKKFASLFAA